MGNRTLLRVTLLALLISFFTFSYGMQVPTFENSKMLNQMAVNDTLLLHDDLLGTLSPANTDWQVGYCFNDVKGKITLGVTTTPAACMPTQFTATVSVRISYWTDDNTLQVSTETLNVNFNKEPGQNYQEKDIRILDKAHYIKVELLSATYSVSGISQFLYLRSEIYEDRFLCTPNTADKPKIKSVSLDASTNEIVINIDTALIKHADEYDLEWTFVDEYDELSQKLANMRYFDFRNNSTRVTLTALQHRLTNIFEQGYVVFRVRVAEYYTDPVTHQKRRVEGAWSITSPMGSKSNDDGYIQSNVNSWIYIDGALAHRQSLNWQYLASYAEEGKKNEGVSYFDGSLRKRQSVSHNFSDATAIVGETIYDYQGRAAIEVLPVPVQNGQITFYPDFNRNPDNHPYSKSDFDADGPTCATATAPMNSTSGAGGYYSSANAFSTASLGASSPVPNFNDYTPIAGGYPFVQTEYMPDNTGRVLSKTLPGATHKLGSGHETRNLYSVPNQGELDKLFGNEVGYANHYKKNMVIDPNGQVSISYQDLSGHTVATALSGAAPTATNALSSNVATVNNITDMITADEPSRIEDNKIIVSKTFTTDQDGAHGFYYETTPQKYMPGYCPGKTPPCYDCVYDLTISLTNLCGEEQLNGNGGTGKVLISRTLGGSPSLIDGSCDAVQTYSFVNDAVLAGSMQNGYLAVNLKQGTTYMLTKTLTVNKKVSDDYVNHYLTNQTCKTLTDFENEEWDRMDKTGCDMSCTECTQQMQQPQYASRAAYITYRDDQYTADGGTSTADLQNDWGDAYDRIKKRCDQICGNISQCDIYQEMLAADITPGGQYAQYQDNNGVPVPTVTTTSAGPMLNILSASDQHYYKKEFTIENVTINGSPVLVKDLDLATFIKYWDQNEKAWSEKFVKYHPEYCEITWCQQTNASRRFDESMLNIETYDDAVNGGYLRTDPTYSPLKTLANVFSAYDPNAPMQILDAIFSMNQDISTTFQNKLTQYQTQSGVTISLWDVPVVELYCSNSTVADLPACIASHRDSVVTCKSYRDFYWKTVRGLYIATKQQLLDQYKKTSCSPNIPSAAQRRILSTDNALSSQSPDLSSINQSDVKDKIADQCSAQCEAYKDEWKATLQGCGLSKSEMDEVLNKMVDVCKRGCDADHPLGSSTVAPANISTTTYNSFEEIFSKPFLFSGTNQPRSIYKKNLCDNILVTMPGSYDHDYYAKSSPLANKCACDPSIASSDPNCPCKGTALNSAVADIINMLRTDIPDNKKCSNCMDCAAFTEYYQLYLDKYGSYHDDSATDQQLLTSFINLKAGFNLTYADYKNHLITCLGYGPINNAFSAFGDLHEQELPTGGMIDNQPLPTPGPPPPGQSVIMPGNSNQGGLPYPHTYINCEDFMSVVNQFFSDQSSIVGTVGSNNIYDWIQTNQTTYVVNLITQLNLVFPSAGFTVTTLKEQFHSCLPMPCDQFLRITSNAHVSIFPTRKNLLNPANQVAVEGDITKLNTFLDNLSANDPIWTQLGLGNIPEYAYRSKFDQQLLLQYADLCQQNEICPMDLKKQVPGDATTTSPARILNELVKPASFGSSTNLLASNGWNVSTKVPGLLAALPYKYKNPSALQYSTVAMGATSGTALSISMNGFNDMPFNMTLHTVCYLGSSQNYQYVVPPADFDYGKITQFIPVRPVSYNYADLVMLFEAKYNTMSGTYSQYVLVSFPTYAFSSSAVNTDISAICYPAHSLCNKPISQVDITVAESPCKTRLRLIAKTNALANWNNYLDGLRSDFENAYLAKCLQASQTEVLKRRYDERLYHYTLYYYDRGGNLVKTVPPAGVTPLSTAQVSTSKSKRGKQSFSDLFAGTKPLDVLLPSHTLLTQYTYNTLNQLIEQNTPDAGTSDFWYNSAGQLVLSQNAKQRNIDRYSYTLYDNLGRITQVGEALADIDISLSSLAFRDKKDLPEWMGWFWQTCMLWDVTNTYYDKTYFTLPDEQNNLRNRVSHITTTTLLWPGDNSGFYEQAVHYNYDIHGNVKNLYRRIAPLSGYFPCIETAIEYEYDLVSGKVTKVTYQPQESDQFIHEYSYDLDNRLKSVQTGTSRWTMDLDASYKYYPHGPLARTELGTMQVQGMDYAYTMQGWLKGVNSSANQAGIDIGKDGYTGLSGNSHTGICPDVYGFSLHYFEGDYNSVKAFSPNSQFTAVTAGSTLSNSAPSLYNGNISAMITSLEKFGWPLASGYTYDQLNRLNSATYYNNYNPYSNSWQTDNPIADYYNKLTYDANGNITQQTRRGSTLIAGNANPLTNLLMDSMTYNYYPGTNQLKQVKDGIYANAYNDDIDNQVSANNYEYDEIGNLVSDEAENIDDIEWNAYGKITSIWPADESQKSIIFFTYTPEGYRATKTVVTPNRDWLHTLYSHDAQGNIMAVYEYDYKATAPTEEFILKEWPIYGSSRLGVNQPNLALITSSPDGNTLSTIAEPSFTNYTFQRGKKRYELTNHLGNVLAVVSDKRIQPCNNVELVSDFSLGNDMTWPPYPGRATATYNSARGRLEVSVSNSGNPGVTRDITNLTVGAVYKATFTLDLNNVSGNIWRLISYSSPQTNSHTVKRLNIEKGIKEYSIVFKAKSTTHTLSILSENSGTVYIYKIVLQRLDAGQMTNGIILNEDYNDGVSVAGWAPWSDNLKVTNAGGKIKVATINPPASSALEGVQKSYNTIPGHIYHVRAYIERTGVDISAFWFGHWDGEYVQWSYQFAAKDFNNATNNGWFDFYFMAKSTTSKLGTYNIATVGIGAYSYTIDNLTVEEVYLPEKQTDLVQANDYSPFGAPLPARSFQSEGAVTNNLVLYDQFVYGKDAWTPDGSSTLTRMSTNQLKMDGSGAWRTPFDVKPNHTYTLDLDYLNNGTEAGVITVINALSGSQIASFNLDGDAKSFTFTTDGSTTLVKFYVGRTSTNTASYTINNVLVKDITTVNNATPQKKRLTKYKFDFNDGTAQGFVGVTGNNTATSSSLTLLVSAYQKNSITCSRVFNGLQGGTTYTVTFSIADAGPAYNTYRINVNQPNGTNIATITYFTPGIHDITFTLPAGLTSATFAISGERGLPYYSNVFNVDDVTLTYTSTINAQQATAGYRFGFNGMERTEEIYGAGNEYTTEFRQYDPRLGRWMSIDPQFRNYPWQSPYAAFDNNPILKNDPRGDAPGDGDPEKTKEAAGNSVSNIKETDPRGSQPARCNQGVAGAFQEITGSTELNGMKANGMAEHMANSSNFTPIPINEAQDAANNGDIVIAAYISSKGSGHVVMVVPGVASDNGTWGGKPAAKYGGIPRVMDTGAGMRNESQPVNESFGKDKQGSVVFYKYTPALTNQNSTEVVQQATQKVTFSNPTTGQTYQFEQKQFILKAAPDPKFSDYLLDSSAPIVRDLGEVVKKMGF